MKIAENRTYDEIAVGDAAEIVRIATVDDFYVFASASGNHNPMHLARHDGDGDGVEEAVAPALWVASLISAVIGNILPGAGTLYRCQSLHFHARAHPGDELATRVTVTEKRPEVSSRSRQKGADRRQSWLFSPVSSSVLIFSTIPPSP